MRDERSCSDACAAVAAAPFWVVNSAYAAAAIGAAAAVCRQRAIPKLTHGTQRFSHMGHTSENEGSTRRNTEDALNGSEEAAP